MSRPDAENSALFLPTVGDAIRGAVEAGDGGAPHTLLMLSGGVDSVSLLVALLVETDHRVHAHHIEIDNHEGRAARETAAVEAVLTECWSRFRDFEFSSSKRVLHLGWGGYDITEAAFEATRVHLVLDSPFDYVVTGHRRDGTSDAEWTEATAVFDAGLVLARRRPTWITPLTGISKSTLLDELPPDLAAMTWSCRQPAGPNGDEPCGECHACTALTSGRPER